MVGTTIHGQTPPVYYDYVTVCVYSYLASNFRHKVSHVWQCPYFADIQRRAWVVAYTTNMDNWSTKLSKQMSQLIDGECHVTKYIIACNDHALVFLVNFFSQ